MQGTMGIAGIDTRDLTIALREVGCLVGVLSTDATKTDEVRDAALLCAACVRAWRYRNTWAAPIQEIAALCAPAGSLSAMRGLVVGL